MSSFDGSVFRPGDEGYEAARCDAVWNGLKPKRFPAVIVVAGSRDDVARAVALAREEGISIGIRSGGHSWFGNAVREGGLLLDLSRLTAIEVDPDARTATVEPSVHSGELAAALTPHGLYFPVGHCSSVALGGFILGGGMGFNSSSVGLAAYSLRAIDVVTADGETLHATDEEHADVLWAARGSGPGFFAALTRLYLDLRPLPKVVASAVQMHPVAAFDDLRHWSLERAPDQRPLMMAVKSPFPGQDETVVLVTGYTFADNVDQARELLAHLQTAPGLDRAILNEPGAPTSIEQLHAMFDGIYPQGRRYLSDNMWVTDTSAPGLWQEARTTLDTLPSAGSSVWFIPGMPYGHPNASFSLMTEMSFQVYAAYEDSEQDETMRAWHTDAIERIDPYTVGGGYVGDSNLFAHPMAILDPANAARLEKLRGQYDPEGRFYSYPSELPPARLDSASADLRTA